RPKLDLDRNSCRASRDGRISQHPFAALAAPPDHARGGDRTCSDCHCILGYQWDGKAARTELSGFEHAAQFCGFSAGAIHQRQAQDGRVRESALVEDTGVGDRRLHCPVERLAARANVSRLSASPHAYAKASYRTKLRSSLRTAYLHWFSRPQPRIYFFRKAFHNEQLQ